MVCPYHVLERHLTKCGPTAPSDALFRTVWGGTPSRDDPCVAVALSSDGLSHRSCATWIWASAFGSPGLVVRAQEAGCQRQILVHVCEHGSRPTLCQIIQLEVLLRACHGPWVSQRGLWLRTYDRLRRTGCGWKFTSPAFDFIPSGADGLLWCARCLVSSIAKWDVSATLTRHQKN
eukprot:6489064-Amphidinium_carterae.1